MRRGRELIEEEPYLLGPDPYREVWGLEPYALALELPPVLRPGERLKLRCRGALFLPWKKLFWYIRRKRNNTVQSGNRARRKNDALRRHPGHTRERDPGTNSSMKLRYYGAKIQILRRRAG